MKMDWVDVRTNGQSDGCYTTKSFFGWVVCVYKTDGIDPLPDGTSGWRFESPCLCKRRNSYICRSVHVPDNRNSVCVLCNECDRKVARITGFITKEWKIQISKEIYDGV